MFKCANLKKVEFGFLAEIDEEVLVVAIPRHMHNSQEVMDAKREELKKWEEYGVYEEVQNEGQFCLGTNWVVVRKPKGVKARLTVRGDLEPDRESIRMDSPMVNKVSIKVFFVIAMRKK